ncbi:MAG TPA: dihydrodipicolinate synthase family protein [Kiritimatiellia bacterium]|nr:dihydrodipicolinate synthase family protein [Kiritimatiellia bacterium]HRU70588.1 dihydrodipicolinate synthase family protein [Kiritimatiellia bacterium]
MRKKVYSASITPLTEDGSLDVGGLNRIIDRNVRHGIDGIFILGSMGEWSCFDRVFRDRMVEESVRALAGRAELLVGITDVDTDAALENMRRVSGYAFDSYVFMLPKGGGSDPVREICRVLDAADRPVYYYHCPPNNGINLSLAQFEAILSHPNLKGIKNSASNMWLRRELLLLKAERGFGAVLLEGQEWAVDEALLVGCDGMLCGIGALGSAFMVGIARATDAGDVAEAVRLQNRLIRLFHGVYGTDLSTVWVGQKYALKCLGLCVSERTLAQRMEALTETRKREIEACVEAFREELD